jgi:hypothetical protein
MLTWLWTFCAGMQGLKGAQVLSFDVSEKDATATRLPVTVNVSFPNPSSFTLDAGRLTFSISSASSTAAAGFLQHGSDHSTSASSSRGTSMGSVYKMANAGNAIHTTNKPSDLKLRDQRRDDAQSQHSGTHSKASPVRGKSPVRGTAVTHASGMSASSLTSCAPFGTVTITEAKLQPGNNMLQAQAYLTGPPSECALSFLSDFINGRTSRVLLAALPDDGGIPLVQTALQGFNLQMDAAGMSGTLVSRADAYLIDPIAVLTSRILHCEISVTSPFGAKIEILGIDVFVSSESATLGALSQDFTKNPIVVPPYETVRTRAVCVKLDKLLNLAVIEAFVRAASAPSGAPLHFAGTVLARIGGVYVARLTMDQGPVRMCIHYACVRPCCFTCVLASARS